MRFWRLVSCALMAAVMWGGIAPAQADSLFDGLTLEGNSGLHLIVRPNVNVRTKPDNSGKSVSKLDTREIVDVLGTVKGTQWVAVKQNGLELGFVFIRSLTPMIDASLKEPLVGRVELTSEGKPDCTYKLKYVGRSREDATVFVAADYLAHFKCQSGFEVFEFDAMMFMSEVPPDLGAKAVYQINMDLPDIAIGYEDFLSAIALYDQSAQKVTMDSVSLSAFREKPFKHAEDAISPKEALQKALFLQLSAFNTTAWKTIAGKIPDRGVEKPEE